jgi:hypothetical protein
VSGIGKREEAPRLLEAVIDSWPEARRAGG